MKNQTSQTTHRSGRRTPHKPRYLKPKTQKEKRRALILRRTVLSVLVLLGCVGALGLGTLCGMFMHNNRQMKELADIVSENRVAVNDESRIPAADASSPTDSESITDSGPTEAPTAPVEPTILPQYAPLYEQNADLFGWIQIENTRINYPVMHTPDDPEKYIHADFDEKYSYGGLPFLDAKCTAESDNLLIYGHNMLDGSMFRALMNYKDPQFWKEHPIIKVDTLYEECQYEVMCVFYDRVYYSYEDVFKFYRFIDADSEEEFDQAIAAFKSKQLYDTGVNAVFGDQLITLVTCDYHTANGRFVVVARKIS